MAHEIYYTSAPQGLRPGQQGWCTVAATAGIPRLLWERMESLSTYPTRSAGSAHMPPVVFAHWIVRLRSEEHHVLSRIADAGVDYSRRANAFAHHLTVDESQRATYGPAGMLMGPGLMAQAWDGQVRILPDRQLLGGDAAPAICRAWEQVCGDAGWGGVVAGELVANPSRPIWLIHAAGQQMLPLIDEAIRLLPPTVRWQATFHTHFTNLPANTLCLIRCCEAGSETANTAMRGGAGFVLNLTSNLQRATDGPWTQLARTGEGTGPLPPTAAVPKAAPPKPLPPKLKKLEVGQQPSNLQPSTCNDQGSILDVGRSISDVPPIPTIPPLPPPRIEAASVSPTHQDWVAIRKQQRSRRLVAIYMIALAAIVAGAWMQYQAYRTSSDRAVVPYIPILPPPPPTSHPPAATQVVILPPATTEATTTQPVEPPQPTTIHVETVRPLPALIMLETLIPPPPPGTGLRDPRQIITIPREKWDDLPAIRMMALSFTNNRSEVVLKSGSELQMKQSADVGILVIHKANGKSPLDIVSIALNRDKSHLEMIWKNAALMNTELTATAWWLLSGSTIVVADDGYRRPQRIQFAPITAKTVDLNEPDIPLSPPVNLPAGAMLAITQQPTGWEVDLSGPSIRLKYPIPDIAEPARFEVHLETSKATIHSDLVSRRAAQNAELAKESANVQKIDDEMKQLVAASKPLIDGLQRQIENSTAWQSLTPEKLKENGHTPESLAGSIVAMKEELKTRQQWLNEALVAPLQKKKEYDKNVANRKAIIAALERINGMELAIMLDDMRLLSLRCK